MASKAGKAGVCETRVCAVSLVLRRPKDGPGWAKNRKGWERIGQLVVEFAKKEIGVADQGPP